MGGNRDDEPSFSLQRTSRNMERARMTLRYLPSLARYEAKLLRARRISCLRYADEEEEEKACRPSSQ